MKTHMFLPIVAALVNISILPSEALAQPFEKNINESRKLRSVLVGGSANSIAANTETAFVGGGLLNTASGTRATIGGGRENTAAGDWATIAGGGVNTGSGYAAAIGGGSQNAASGERATISGGYGNTASGDYATVPGGANAEAIHNGSFVWSGDPGELTQSFNPGTFTVRCEGGARFYTANGVGTAASLPPGGTSFAALSDSNSKTDFRPIKPREILSKVAALPVSAWRYKHDPKRLYIGPMAQDFRAAFGLGYDDKSISTLDSDGVMYAAIQGLVEELRERDVRHEKDLAARDQTIEELKKKTAKTDARNKQLSARIEAVNTRLNSLPPAP